MMHSMVSYVRDRHEAKSEMTALDKQFEILRSSFAEQRSGKGPRARRQAQGAGAPAVNAWLATL